MLVCTEQLEGMCYADAALNYSVSLSLEARAVASLAPKTVRLPPHRDCSHLPGRENSPYLCARTQRIRAPLGCCHRHISVSIQPISDYSHAKKKNSQWARKHEAHAGILQPVSVLQLDL